MAQKRSTKRQERVPLTGLTKKLEVPKKFKRPGYVQYWFNDMKGRLQQAEAAWWSYVTDPELKVGEGEDRRDDLSSKVRTIVGTHDNGAPIYAYLMEIQEKFYKEDLKVKHDRLNEIDDAIKRGAGGGGEPGLDGKYIPAQGIQYENRLE